MDFCELLDLMFYFPCRFNKDTSESEDKSATHVFSDRLTITECGNITLELIHSPGETNDQVNVWWPDRKIFFPGDNIYRAFPNLYAIRGTASRDTQLWTKAVDLMRSYEPEILVPQHTRPLVGKEVIMETLTAYRYGLTIFSPTSVSPTLVLVDLGELKVEFYYNLT